VIFFLTPPVYMFITSLKSSAEISAATNPWWVYHPTLSELHRPADPEPISDLPSANSAIVSVCVVSIHDGGQHFRRVCLGTNEVLGFGDFGDRRFSLTCLIPESLLFIPLFKTFAYIHDAIGIELINHGGC